MNDTERLNDHEHVYRCQDCGEIQDISALLDEARLDELEHLPWKRADRYGINSPYVTKQWLIERKAQLTPRKEQ